MIYDRIQGNNTINDLENNESGDNSKTFNLKIYDVNNYVADICNLNFTLFST